VTAANSELAEQLRRQADDASARRRVLLTASVALSTTPSTLAAIRALGEWNGPATIKTAAIELLEQLTRDVPGNQAGTVQKATS
jgi:hypothetical protein